MLSFWRNHMHQSAVAKKNHSENKIIFPGVYAIFAPCVLDWTQPWRATLFQTNSGALSWTTRKKALNFGGKGGHLLFICTETAVFEAYKFISKVEIETFFLVSLLFKQVREEGTLNRGGRSFEIMANGVGAYSGEDAR